MRKPDRMVKGKSLSSGGVHAPVIVAVVLALAAIGVATIWWRVPTREHVLARTGEVPSP